MTDPVPSPNASVENGEMDIFGLLRRLWGGWVTIFAYSAAGLLFAICYLHLSAYSYRAQLILVPTQGQNVSMSGQLGQLASLAGVDLNRGQSVAPFVLFPVTLMTRKVADDLAAHRPDLMHSLFKDQWDNDAHRWVAPSGFGRSLVMLVKSILGIPNLPWHPPGGAELQGYLKDKVNIDQNLKLPVLTLTLDSKDSEFAIQTLLALDESTDRVLRQITLERSTKYAEYLENKLQTEQQTALRQVLINSLSEQETQVMMSSSNAPFAAQPLGPPERSPKAVAPVPFLVLMFGIVIGGLAGCAAAIFGIGMIRHSFIMRFFGRRGRGIDLYEDA